MPILDSTVLRELIVYKHIDVLRKKDQELDRVFLITRLKYHHPSVFAIAPRPTQNSDDLNLRSLSEKLESSLKEETDEIYHYLTGKEASCNIELLNSEIDKFLLEVRLLAQLDREISSVKISIYKAAEDYFRLFKKNVQEFKLTFKLTYDHSVCNLFYAKSYALCLKHRFEETEKAVDMYGKKSIIDKLKYKINDLESQNKALKQEIAEKQKLLEQYDKLDPVLMKKYLALKEELNCRLWAYKLMDQVSNSSSGSIECCL